MTRHDEALRLMRHARIIGSVFRVEGDDSASKARREA